MLINLTDVFTEEEKSVTKEVPLELTSIRFQGEDFRILEKTPVRLTLANNGQGRALIEADAEVTVELKFAVHASVVAVSPDVANAEEQDEESGFLEGYQLNVDSLISNEIITCWPMKILCKEDCKGLCSVCGKDLNEGTCDCDTFVPDPRMAAIMDIFRENKEV